MKDNSNLTWSIYSCIDFSLRRQDMKPDEVKIALQLSDDEFLSLSPEEICSLLFKCFYQRGVFKVLYE